MLRHSASSEVMADNHETHVASNRDGDHVLVDGFVKLSPRVVTVRDDVHRDLAHHEIGDAP